MELYFEVAGNQIDGARDYQEDAFLTTFLDSEEEQSKSASLVVVTDGMGGHAAGNIASNLVVSTFNKSVTSGLGGGDVPNVLHSSLLKANDALRESIRETPALDGMGCTMVASVFAKGRLWWVSVGDSHLYLLRDRKLHKKNEDHSYGGYLDRMRKLGMDVETEPGLSRNMLMSAMTGEDIAEIDCPEEPLTLQSGDRLIIATDGLDTLGEGALIQYSSWSETPKECVDALLKAVEDAEKPRQDNTTVVVVDVMERSRAVAQKAEPDDDFHAGDTQPVDMAAIVAEVEAARPAAEPPPVRDTEMEESAPRSRAPLVAGLVLAAAVAAGGGAWLFMKSQDVPPPQPRVVVRPPAPPAPAPSPPPVATPDAPAPVAPPEVEPAPSTAAVDEPPPAPQVSVKPFRDKLRGGGSGPEMVGIKGGSFQMGSSGLSVKANERPRHTVEVKPFAMGRYEVTFAEYEAFARATGRAMPDRHGLDAKTHPVFLVTWADAASYARWLAEQTGKPYRLPTEAEWEFAAAGGQVTPFWWGYKADTGKAHCFNCTPGLNAELPVAVGSFEPNPYGLYDTAGNVLEWVQDCYYRDYEGAPVDGTARDATECSNRVARGGSFRSPPSAIRTRARSRYAPGGTYDTVGFRVARDL